MRIALLCLVASLAAAAHAAAQLSPPVLTAPRARAAEVTGACVTGASVELTVTTNGSTVRLAPVACADGMFAVDLSTIVLEPGSRLAATQTQGAVTSAPGSVTVVLDGPFGDEREDFESSAYVGLAIDRFAAQEVQRYLNPQENGVRHLRDMFGIDFQYRLGARPDTDQAPQLWVYGETLHGVRSEDVDCAVASNLPSCQTELARFGASIPQNALFMLRNASTLEALAGLRYEFRSLNLPGANPARVYVKGQLGFVEVTQSDGDAKAMHHVAVGATAVGGSRAGSYFEIGWGRTDLFLRNRNTRLKIDGHFVQSIAGGFGFFAQIFADVDGADGADAIQSYFGLSVDVGDVVGTIRDLVP